MDKKTRAPGAGRPKLPESIKRQVVTIRLSPDQRTYVKQQGGAKFIRELIDRERNVVTTSKSDGI